MACLGGCSENTVKYVFYEQDIEPKNVHHHPTSKEYRVLVLPTN